MFRKLGAFTHSRRWWIVGVWLLAVVAGIAATGPLSERVTAEFVGSDRIDGLLAHLAGWLPEMDLLQLSSDADGIAVAVALLPGTDAALIRKRLPSSVVQARPRRMTRASSSADREKSSRCSSGLILRA